MANNLTIKLHIGFSMGQHSDSFCFDRPFMEIAEKEILANWIFDILNCNDHNGRNKPSWIDNGHEIPGTSIYKNEQVWHYHCGPFKLEAEQKTKWDLDWNEDGIHSPAAFHYSKKSKETIVILGYSRNHVPFKKSNDLSNPLRARASTLKHSDNWES